ncbi:amidohydrolase family protein [Reyranella sp.]|uniref:amidohydrolase family protein n=1 Tax=Reyranella sp. TaxID=1929291 RepID=UPI003BA8B701
MSEITLETVTAGWLLPSADAPLATGKLLSWQGSTIIAVDDVGPSQPSSSGFVLPSLANGHDHCRGICNVSFGATDQSLEMWLPAMYNAPEADPYLIAGVAYARMARSGIGSVVHFHVPHSPAALLDEAVACARAARDIGIRLAFCVPMRDRNRLAYGPDAALLSHVEPALQEEIRRRFDRPVVAPAEQVALVEAIAREIEDDTVTVQFCPTGIQWCSDALIEAIAEASAESGRRVQMHLLETRRQREFADGAYPQGVVRYLDSVGLLSDRLTIAHGVWLRPDEIELLGERGVTVAVNTSSNLRLRSGIAPVAAFLDAGMPVALGVDNMALDDDDDGFRELRLAHYVHDGVGFDQGGLSWRRALRAMCETGHRAVTGRTDIGRLQPGAPADFVVLDYDSLSSDANRAADPLLLTLARATARNVMRLVVGGRTVVADSRLATFDLAGARAELTAQASRSIDRIVGERPFLAGLRNGMKSFYDSGAHRSAGWPSNL